MTTFGIEVNGYVNVTVNSSNLPILESQCSVWLHLIIYKLIS